VQSHWNALTSTLTLGRINVHPVFNIAGPIQVNSRQRSEGRLRDMQMRCPGKPTALNCAFAKPRLQSYHSVRKRCKLKHKPSTRDFTVR
jgi:hypothetical protein